jgi:hypothetical protein
VKFGTWGFYTEIYQISSILVHLHMCYCEAFAGLMYHHFGALLLNPSDYHNVPYEQTSIFYSGCRIVDGITARGCTIGQY